MITRTQESLSQSKFDGNHSTDLSIWTEIQAASLKKTSVWRIPFISPMLPLGGDLITFTPYNFTQS